MSLCITTNVNQHTHTASCTSSANGGTTPRPTIRSKQTLNTVHQQLQILYYFDPVTKCQLLTLNVVQTDLDSLVQGFKGTDFFFTIF